MRALFSERPDLCDATLDIADMCRYDLGLGRIHFPDFPTPEGRSADAVLAERCWRGVHERGMPRDRGPARPAAPRALDDPAHGVRGVLPHRGRHRRRREDDGHPGGVPGVGRRLARVLPHRHLRRRRAAPRPVVRAVHEPDAQGPARHRHRRGVGAARGRLRHDPRPPRRGARRVRRDDRHLPRALGDPRGRQGARAARRRGRRRREVVPAHLGPAPARGDRPPARAGGHQPALRADGTPDRRRREDRRLPAAHRAAPLRHRARLARSRANACRSSAARTATA